MVGGKCPLDPCWHSRLPDNMTATIAQGRAGVCVASHTRKPLEIKKLVTRPGKPWAATLPRLCFVNSPVAIPEFNVQL